MANPWLQHVKKCREAHPEWSYSKALKECKKTYTPVGGPAPKKSKSTKRTKRTKGKKSKRTKRTRRR